MTPVTNARVTFVLGGGGGPGLAFHCGALRALEDVAGLRLADADLAIGTSAGAVIASRLASGHRLEDIVRSPRPPVDAADVVAETLDGETGSPAMQRSSRTRGSLLSPSWTSRAGLARSALGAGIAVSRSLGRLPTPRPLLAPIERLFPPAMFHFDDWQSTGLGDEWPDQPLWLVTVDTNSNRRVALHRLAARSDAQAPLVQAVAASCAVPGVFPPVRIGRHALVDGGVHSPTNVDLAARARSQVVIALAPLAFDPSFPINRARAAARSPLNAMLRRETRIVARAGGRTLVLRPSGADLAARRGTHLFSQSRSGEIMERAYATTREILRRPYAQRIVEHAMELLASSPPRGRVRSCGTY